MDPLRRSQRHRRLRSRIQGTAARPRVSVFRSAGSLTLQFIDDQSARTLLHVTHKASGKKTKVDQAERLGREAAKLAQAKGITRVVFDRSGYKYHGRVKAVAESLRAGGLNF
ncbi:MAG: 50S ribosomal protein L18 [Candidatus Andersenbacteria bacterium]